MGELGATETSGEELSQLVASDVSEQKKVTVAKGENLKRGAVMGIVTSELRIEHGTVTDGPYEVGETVTDQTLSGTAVVDVVGDGFLDVSNVSGDIAAPNTLAGGTSGASAPITDTVVEQNKYKELDPDDGNGTETARSILLQDTDASAADQAAQAYFMGTYRLDDLVWPDGITDAQKNAALLQLQDRGILVDKDFV